MPNYGLFVNSTFRPFSYAEMIQPVQQMNQAYENLENYYSELDSSASSLLNILPDSEARRGVEAYMNTMNTLQDKLSKEGITRENKRAALGAKTLYNQYMAPTAQATEKALKEQAKVNELRLTNPNILIQGKSGLGAIDTYLKDPQYSAFNVTANLDVGKKQLQEIAINMAKEVSVGKKQGTGISYNYLLPIFSGPRKDVIDKYQMYNALKGRGSQEDLMNFLNSISNEEAAVFNLFDKHLNTAMNSIGMTKENGWNDNQIQQASEYISQAWYNAIAPTQYKQMQDSYGMNIGIGNYKNRNTPPPSYTPLTHNYQRDISSGITSDHIKYSKDYKGVVKKENGKIIYKARNSEENKAYSEAQQLMRRLYKSSFTGSLTPEKKAELKAQLEKLKTDPKTKKGALQAELDFDPKKLKGVDEFFINDFTEGYDQIGVAGLQYIITDSAEKEKIRTQLPEKINIAEESSVTELNNKKFFKVPGKDIDGDKYKIDKKDLDFDKELKFIGIGDNLIFQTVNKDGETVYIDAESIFNTIGPENTKRFKEAITNRNEAMFIAQSNPDAYLLAKAYQQKADAYLAAAFGENRIEDNKYNR